MQSSLLKNCQSLTGFPYSSSFFKEFILRSGRSPTGKDNSWKNSRWKPSFLLSFWHSCSCLLGAWGLKKLLKHFQHYKRTKWALTVFLSLNIFWKKRNSCWCIISGPLSSKLGLFPGIFGTSAFRRFPGVKRKYSTTWKRRFFFKFILSFKFYKFTFTDKLIDLQL